MKKFQFPFYDYLHPVSVQVKLVRDLTPSDLVNYSPITIQKAFHRNIPPFSPKTQSRAVSSFEDLWHKISDSKSWYLPDKTSGFIAETNSLICSGKINLYWIVEIYDILSRSARNFEELWMIYNELIGSFFLSFSPEEMIRVIEAHEKMRFLTTIKTGWVLSLEKISKEQLDEFSLEQLARLFLFIEECGLNLKQAEDKIKDLTTAKGLYQFCYLVKRKKILINDKVLTEFCEKLSVKEKYELALMGEKLKFRDSFFVVIFESIINENFDVFQALSLCDIILRRNCLLGFAEKIVLKFEEKISSFSFEEYIKLLESLCILRSLDVIVPENYLEKLEKKIIECVQLVDYRNFHTLVHFFSYSIPVRSVHELLCRIIIENERPDSVEIKRPSHEYFQSQGDSLLVLNNTLLTKIALINLTDIVTCLPFRYQISKSLRSILKKYLILVVHKYYYKTFLKHRCKILFMLSIPENFDKDLITITLNSIQKDLSKNHSISVNYPLMHSVKNLENVGYHHPIFNLLKNSQPLH